MLGQESHGVVLQEVDDHFCLTAQVHVTARKSRKTPPHISLQHSKLTNHIQRAQTYIEIKTIMKVNFSTTPDKSTNVLINALS